MTIKYLGRFALAAALTLSLPAFAQPQTDAGAKQDMKDAGHETKNAAKDAGHSVKQGTKKAYHKTKRGVKKAHRKMDPDTPHTNPQ